MKVTDNKYIPAEDRDFFILLRTGLWQRVEEPLSTTPDWAYIFKLACEQTVQGIVADGIALYMTEHPECSVDRHVFEQFLDQTAQIVRQNYEVNQVQERVCKLLDEGMPSYPYFIVKGQEAAKEYPKPMLRCSGDIDIVVLPAHYVQAQTILQQASGNANHENTQLIDTSYHFTTGSEGQYIEVELHATLHPNLGQRIDRVLDQMQEKLFADCQYFDTYCTIYYFLHCLQHFHWSGLGIRQITDWCMLLTKMQQRSSAHTIYQSIAGMHLQHEWCHFLAFCCNYLGMPQDVCDTWNLTLETSNPVDSLWLACKATGNMGHNRRPKDRICFTPMRVIYDWIDNLRQYFAYRHISPTVSRELVKVKMRLYWHALKEKIQNFKEHLLLRA